MTVKRYGKPRCRAFEDGTFDVATSSFGLFFLEDMTHALNKKTGVRE